MSENNDFIIAIGLDGSASAWKAFDEALVQAKTKNAALHVVSVQEAVDAAYSAQEALASAHTERDHIEEMQHQARVKGEGAGVQIVTAVQKGHFPAALLEYLKQRRVSMLILGGVGHSSIWGALLGTNVDKLVRNAPCSVLIVR